MLKIIQNDITDLCRVMSTVIGVNIEIVDVALTRIAGTGIYSNQVGEQIGPASGIYQKVFDGAGTIYVDNPGQHPACQGCLALNDCPELLNLCTPIELDGQILGVIGLICFEPEEKLRVAQKKEVFWELIGQLAQTIARRVQAELSSEKARQTLDALLEIANFGSHGVVIVSRQGSISYINQAAAAELNLGQKPIGLPIQFRDTGNNLAGMAEYEVKVNGQDRVVFGNLKTLRSSDPIFHLALVTEPMPRLSDILSQVGSSVDSPGGLQAIVGASEELAKLKAKVLRIASTSSTVLITGESGTGKEMFARAIHAESPRFDKPFVAINCGAIPDELLESELFGYVRGAFTGASQTGRMGKFELANGGVIFLDEISSMSLYLQVKLLRVLQEKTFSRLGSNRLITVDVRVIAASNDDLLKMIDERRFRGDLFFRLNVIPLELPPLRQRLGDIPVLAEYFLDRYCRRFGKPPARLTPGILKTFLAYHWPGNVREFENCIEYMVNLHEGGPLNESLVPANIRVATMAAKETRADLTTVSPSTPPENEVVALERLEREAICGALARFGHTTTGKKEAARALGIGLATLYRRLRHLGLSNSKVAN
ncbi:MAG: sigma 54-interacting transcriptional regulator [Deltaproteobacteria bacterium]|jgi:transcriptional regulator with PAS, ATPase and Fis domain|nr:sigma 54-interacting transcriptional regulator [Deltaproteobacteria bacterium]